MSQPSTTCIVCDSMLASSPEDGGQHITVDCPVCGRYRMMWNLEPTDLLRKRSRDDRYWLSCLLRQASVRGDEPELEEVWSQLDRRLPPPPSSEQVERGVVEFIRSSSRFGFAAIPIAQTDWARLGCPGVAGLEAVLVHLDRERRIVLLRMADGWTASMTPEGAKRAGTATRGGREVTL